MAGLGWKLWTRERLTADEMQGYLQDQVVLNFASASARDAALGSTPPDGMVVHLRASGQTLVRVAGAWQGIAAMAQVQAVAYAADVQTGLAAGWRTITLGNESVDTHGAHGSGPGVVIPAGWGGTWSASGCVGFAAQPANTVQGARLAINGTAPTGGMSGAVLGGFGHPGGSVVPLPEVILPNLVAGDVITLEGYCAVASWATLASGGNGASTSRLTMRRLS